MRYRTYVCPEVALAMKEEGFRNECSNYYSYSEGKIGNALNNRQSIKCITENYNKESNKVSAPTYQQALDYLRFKKYIDIHVATECTVNEILGYTGHIHFIMGLENTRVLVESEDEKENFDYYLMLEKTILAALKLYHDSSITSYL